MLKYEPHVHSRHSDGKHSVRKILSEAVRKKIDIISITDHDTLNGSFEAIKIVNEEHLHIKVTPGIEVSTKKWTFVSLWNTKGDRHGDEND